MKILSPAKINLFLQILGKRLDGYNDLITLMCFIGLYDKVSLKFCVKDITVSCDHADVDDPAERLSHAPENAAELLLVQPPGQNRCVTLVGVGLAVPTYI